VQGVGPVASSSSTNNDFSALAEGVIVESAHEQSRSCTTVTAIANHGRPTLAARTIPPKPPNRSPLPSVLFVSSPRLRRKNSVKFVPGAEIGRFQER